MSTTRHLQQETHSRWFTSEHISQLRGAVEILDVDYVRESDRKTVFERTLDELGVKEGLLRLLLRPWFTRLWTLQEAENVSVVTYHIGEGLIDQASMLALVRWLESDITARKPMTDSPTIDLLEKTSVCLRFNRQLVMWDIDNNAQNYEEASVTVSNNLEFLASSSRYLACSEPRDKIYALLSATQWVQRGVEIPFGLTPNYDEPLEQVMCRATKAMLSEASQRHVLRIICGNHSLQWGHKAPSNSGDVAWPSWCPRWDITASESAGKGMDWASSTAAQTGRQYAACGVRGYDKNLLLATANVMSLIVEGFVVDTVYYSSSDNVVGEYKNTKGPLYRGFVGYAEKRATEILSIALAGKASAEEILEDLTAPKRAGADMSWTGLQIAYLSVCHGQDRRVFISDSESLGLGPAIVQPGDSIVILFGLDYPAILRSSGEHFLFLGLGYIPGMMYSEALADWEKKGEKSTRFELR